MDINSLPVESLIQILKKTDGETVGTCRRVSKLWKECIDGTGPLWQYFCHKDFKCASQIAKRKASNECSWYHIYKNLKMWSKISDHEVKLRHFYQFTLFHALDTDYGILSLRDAKGVVLYDTNSLSYIPVAIPDRHCSKMMNSDHCTAIQLKAGLLLQRSVKDASHSAEALFRADDFVLTKDYVYFYNNRDIFKCNLTIKDIIPELVIHLDHNIKELQYNNGYLFVFTDDGYVVTLNNAGFIQSCQALNCPPEWIRQIKHISAVDDKNFVCYSRNLFKIETDEYQHLYLDFPPITALFFYGDIVLIGTRLGEILIYRLSSQKSAIKSRKEPIFEKLATLPEGKIAVHLDVCERKTGPIIIAATFQDIFILETNFFPFEQNSKKVFPEHKLLMYKRLLKIRDRIQNSRETR